MKRPVTRKVRFENPRSPLPVVKAFRVKLKNAAMLDVLEEGRAESGLWDEGALFREVARR